MMDDGQLASLSRWSRKKEAVKYPVPVDNKDLKSKEWKCVPCQRNGIELFQNDRVSNACL